MLYGIEREVGGVAVDRVLQFALFRRCDPQPVRGVRNFRGVGPPVFRIVHVGRRRIRGQFFAVDGREHDHAVFVLLRILENTERDLRVGTLKMRKIFITVWIEHRRLHGDLHPVDLQSARRVVIPFQNVQSPVPDVDGHVGNRAEHRETVIGITVHGRAVRGERTEICDADRQHLPASGFQHKVDPVDLIGRDGVQFDAKIGNAVKAL